MAINNILVVYMHTFIYYILYTYMCMCYIYYMYYIYYDSN